ncbi:MAG: DPP IV N-terminal domain-containing protein [Fimbriimonadaceae bacterium]|nr:DPP IV N-terminal domain-containing protein [Fimbriimonadaceae bacterium]
MRKQSFRAVSRLSILAMCLVIGAGAVAQGPSANRPLKANWKLANRFTAESLRPFVYSSSLTPGWINRTDNFWYSWRDSRGVRFWRVDPKARKKEALFDVDRMAAHLSELTKKPYDSTNLPISTVTFDEKNDKILRFTIETNRYEYDSEKDTLKLLPRTGPGAAAAPPATQGGQGGRGRGQGGAGGPASQAGFRNFSPDRKAYVYAMDHNLYYVSLADGKESDPIQLTKDGEKDYSFGSRDTAQQFQQFQQEQQQEQQEQQQEGTGSAQSQEKRVRANVTWSKDSKRFFVSRGDSRKVKELFLVNNLAMPRPTLLTYKYAMPGEPDVTQTELFVFDPDKKELLKLPVDKYKDQRLSNIHFQDTTSDSLRFVRRDRLQRNLEFCEIDLASSKIKALLTESVENAFLEVQTVRYVKPGGDFLWFSERTGWGHQYLYANDGTFKNAVTSGPFRADSIVEVDPDKELIWFRGMGRETGENPYYRHLYRTKFDGKDLELLDPGEADHSSTLSPSKNFLVDVGSRTDIAPKAVVRDSKGKIVMELEAMDLTKLEEVGWRMPERFTVKAADGVTDIYGNMWRPTDFDPNKRYPIIANVYPGPQTESVTAGFSATATNQRLAQLGFIVIQIGNRGGNPARSNAYHSYGYYNLRDYGLADKKAGIEQLAARHPWIDVDRVGIFGHSGGGFMTAAALMLPPYNDFFKVGVSSAGNHDNNIYNANWSEQHHGLKEVPVKDKTGKDTAEKKFEIRVPTNDELAANLKGKLLLVHGDMDNNVHPAGTMRLVNALIKANKRFDFMIMPGKAHGFADMQPYFTQMMMEYFAEHLLGDYYRAGAEMKVGT